MISSFSFSKILPLCIFFQISLLKSCDKFASFQNQLSDSTQFSAVWFQVMISYQIALISLTSKSSHLAFLKFSPISKSFPFLILLLSLIISFYNVGLIVTIISLSYHQDCKIYQSESPSVWWIFSLNIFRSRIYRAVTANGSPIWVGRSFRASKLSVYRLFC